MNREEMSMIAMEIVAYAGDARTKFLKAMDAIADEDYETAEKLIREGDELVVGAHKQEKDLVAQETAGAQVDITFFIVHAQDYLMTSMLLSDLCKRFVKIFRSRKA